MKPTYQATSREAISRAAQAGGANSASSGQPTE